MAELPPDLLAQIFVDPRQRSAEVEIAELLAALDACDNPADYDRLQREIFGCVYELEEHRGQCSRIEKRLKKGESLPPEHPDLGDRDPSEPGSWRYEIFLTDRIARHYRTVGDGLAWQVLDYNRSLVIALSHNKSPGLMAGKAGLAAELGAVDEVFRERGNFGLLHGLTNCLLIGDVTEVDPGARSYRLLEVKSSPGRRRSGQTARAQAAVEAIVAGGPLPGRPGSGIVQVSASFDTNFRPFQDAVSLAAQRGAVTLSPGRGRAIHAASVIGQMQRYENAEAAISATAENRDAGLRRARLASSRHLLSGRTGDAAGRSARVAPLSIVPLRAEDRAALICDSIVIEVIVSADKLLDLLNERGVKARSLLQDHNGGMDPEVFSVTHGSSRLTMHPDSLAGLLYEGLEPEAWADSVVELVRRHTFPSDPEVVFQDESRAWRRGHPR